MPDAFPIILWGQTLNAGAMPEIGGAALAAVVIVAGAWWWYASRLLPSSWRVAGDALVVVDDQGRECWRKVFGFSLTDYQFFVERNQAVGWVGDLDGDGEPEVLFAAIPRGIGAPMVYCFPALAGSAGGLSQERRPAGFRKTFVHRTSP